MVKEGGANALVGDQKVWGGVKDFRGMESQVGKSLVGRISPEHKQYFFNQLFPFPLLAMMNHLWIIHNLYALEPKNKSLQTEISKNRNPTTRIHNSRIHFSPLTLFLKHD